MTRINQTKGNFRFLIKPELKPWIVGDLNIDLLQELRIETTRLQRHTNFLSNHFKDTGARDMVVSLRNMYQLQPLIDKYAVDNNLQFSFMARPITKAEKNTYRISESIYHYLDEPLVRSNGKMIIQSVGYRAGVVTQQKLQRTLAAQNSSKPVLIKMTLASWFSRAVFEVTTKDITTTINRGHLVDRLSAMLGGAHPAAMYSFAKAEEKSVETKKTDQAILRIIDESQTIGEMPSYYAEIYASSQALIRAFQEVFFLPMGRYDNSIYQQQVELAQ